MNTSFSNLVRMVVSVVVAVGVMLTLGCTAPPDPDRLVSRVQAGGSTLRLGGVEVVLPPGVAPIGTQVVLRRERQAGTGAAAVPLSEGITIELGDRLQPSVPLTIAFTVAADQIPASDGSSERLVVRSTSAGEVRLHTGSYDAASGKYVVEVDHLSNFQLYGLDLGKVLEEVRTAVLQGIGLEYPRPSCADEKAKIGDATYSVVQPPQTWVCLVSEGGDLLVRAYPNSAIPFLVSSSSKPRIRTTPTDVKIATSALVAIAGALGFIGEREAAVLPGTTAELRFKGSPDAVTLTFDQFPALLLMSILATTLDTVAATFGITFVLKDSLDGLQCLADAADVAQRGARLNGETAAGVAKAFFDCVGPMMGKALGAKGAVIIAILGSAPGFLVGSLLGLINEFTGLDRAKVALDVTRPARTTVLRLDPLTPVGDLGSGFKLDTSNRTGEPVDCSYDTGSRAGVTPGTHDCGTTADSCAAALASPRHPGFVLCLNSAFDPTLRLTPALNLKKTGTPRDPEPLGLETSDGSRWTLRFGGSWGGRADGAVGAYACHSGPCTRQQLNSKNQVILAMDDRPTVDTTGTQWVVFVGDIGDPNKNYPAPVSLGVTKAWFLSNAAA